MRAQTGNLLEERVAGLLRLTIPWALWMIGIPLATISFWALHRLIHHDGFLVSWGLGVGTILVTWLTWKVTSSRNRVGRWHHTLNALGILGWMTLATTYGWRGPLVIAYAVGGFIGCIVWNVRYSTHVESAVDVLEAPSKVAQLEKRVDVAYMIRLLASRYPAIRQGAEAGGKAFPVLVQPWRETPRAIATSETLAITSGGEPADGTVSAGDMRSAEAMWQRINRNWRDLTTHKRPELNGARITPLSIQPWRIRAKIILVRGVQVPDMVIGSREFLASQCGMPLSSVLPTPNGGNHREVFIDFVLQDVLGTTRVWPGPVAIGRSIGDAPMQFGLYEDRVIAERFGPAITPAMAARLGRPEKVLTHLIDEGMNGSGKSHMKRLFVTDRATRIDVEEWLIDTVKKTQTFGHLGQAFDWFATTRNEARNMALFVAERVIPARAEYLGNKGLDNWEPGCGLPYLVITVEEGGVIAQELDKLDEVLMTARSAGVEINLSIQRAHHGLLDTNVRAQLSDAASFGVKSLEDVFAMPDELLHAGADPSRWQNKKPGMLFYAPADLDLERWLMAIRTFNERLEKLREIVAEHEPTRRAWIQRHCPDWTAMLERIDVNGVYKNRTTGDAILATIEQAERARGITPPKRGTPKPVGSDAEEARGDAEALPFPVGGSRMDADEEVVEGELVDDDEVAGEDRRELLLTAATWVVNTQLAVEAMLMRKMGVTAPIAAELMNELERRGIVGPPSDTEPREVLVTAGSLTEIVAKLVELADDDERESDRREESDGTDGTDMYDEDEEDLEDNVTLEELGLDGELGAAVRADRDAGVDVTREIPALDGPPWEWQPPQPGADVSRADALRAMRLYLRSQGVGWEFQPRDLYVRLGAAIGKSPSWIRTALTTTFLTEGLVERDETEGRYTVGERAREVTEHGDLDGPTLRDVG